MSDFGRRPEDLTRQIFGKLTALEFVRTHNNGASIWKCVCACVGIKGY